MDVREKLVELIIDAKKTDPKTGSFTDRLANHLIANGVTVQEWISGEQLPEEPGYYLCHVLYEGGYCGQGLRLAYYYGDGRRDWLVGRTDVVTHWMPLPQPPKGE